MQSQLHHLAFRPNALLSPHTTLFRELLLRRYPLRCNSGFLFYSVLLSFSFKLLVLIRSRHPRACALLRLAHTLCFSEFPLFITQLQLW